MNQTAMKGQLHLKMSQSGGVAQVAEHWTSKCEALSSSLSIERKKREKKKKNSE